MVQQKVTCAQAQSLPDPWRVRQQRVLAGQAEVQQRASFRWLSGIGSDDVRSTQSCSGEKCCAPVAWTKEYEVREGGRSRQLDGKDACLAKRWRWQWRTNYTLCRSVHLNTTKGSSLD